MAKNVTQQELKLAVLDLRDIESGRDFLNALNKVVRPYGKLDIVYRDRARVLLHAMIESEWLGTLNQETMPDPLHDEGRSPDQVKRSLSKKIHP